MIDQSIIMKILEKRIEEALTSAKEGILKKVEVEFIRLNNKSRYMEVKDLIHPFRSVLAFISNLNLEWLPPPLHDWKEDIQITFAHLLEEIRDD